MFAIFLTEGMDPFYRNIASFPTALFTFALALCVLYWLVAVIGLVDVDVLDLGDADGSDSGRSSGTAASLLMRLGLNGVPTTVVITIVAFFGWLISYYAMHFLGPLAPGALARYALGLVVLGVALYGSVLISSVVIRPLRTLFKKAERHVVRHVLGQTAVVRTSSVTESFGEATLEDGGAGLILKVRADPEAGLGRGDRVVLLEYDRAANTYRVIPEDEFTRG